MQSPRTRQPLVESAVQQQNAWFQGGHSFPPSPREIVSWNRKENAPSQSDLEFVGTTPISSLRSSPRDPIPHVALRPTPLSDTHSLLRATPAAAGDLRDGTLSPLLSTPRDTPRAVAHPHISTPSRPSIPPLTFQPERSRPTSPVVVPLDLKYSKVASSRRWSPPSAVSTPPTPEPTLAQKVLGSARDVLFDALGIRTEPTKDEDQVPDEDQVANLFHRVLNPKGSAQVLGRKVANEFVRRRDLAANRRKRHEIRGATHLWQAQTLLKRLELESAEVQGGLRTLKSRGPVTDGSEVSKFQRLVMTRSLQLRACTGLWFLLEEMVHSTKLSAFCRLDEEAVIRSSTPACANLLLADTRVRAIEPLRSERKVFFGILIRTIRRLVLRQLASTFFRMSTLVLGNQPFATYIPAYDSESSEPPSETTVEDARHRGAKRRPLLEDSLLARCATLTGGVDPSCVKTKRRPLLEDLLLARCATLTGGVDPSCVKTKRRPLLEDSLLARCATLADDVDPSDVRTSPDLCDDISELRSNGTPVPQIGVACSRCGTKRDASGDIAPCPHTTQRRAPRGYGQRAKTRQKHRSGRTQADRQDPKEASRQKASAKRRVLGDIEDARQGCCGVSDLKRTRVANEESQIGIDSDREQTNSPLISQDRGAWKKEGNSRPEELGIWSSRDVGFQDREIAPVANCTNNLISARDENDSTGRSTTKQASDIHSSDRAYARGAGWRVGTYARDDSLRDRTMRFEMNMPPVISDGKKVSTFTTYGMPLKEYNGVYRRVESYGSGDMTYINDNGRYVKKVGDEWIFSRRLHGIPDIVALATTGKNSYRGTQIPRMSLELRTSKISADKGCW